MNACEVGRGQKVRTIRCDEDSGLVEVNPTRYFHVSHSDILTIQGAQRVLYHGLVIESKCAQRMAYFFHVNQKFKTGPLSLSFNRSNNPLSCQIRCISVALTVILCCGPEESDG